MDLAALATELATDPLKLSYAPYVAKANDWAVAKLLNATEGPGVGDVPAGLIDGSQLLRALDPDDFVKLTADQCAQLSLLFAIGKTGQSGIDLSNDETFAIFTKLLSQSMPTTAGNLSTLRTRKGSRAEVLFGAGTTITAEQVGGAR